MDLPLRKILNLAFDWIIEAHAYDSDGWEKQYARVFDRSVSDEEYEHGYDVVDPDALGLPMPDDAGVSFD